MVRNTTSPCVSKVSRYAFASADYGPRLDFYATTSSRYCAAVATGIWCGNWEMGCDELGIGGRFQQLSDDERGSSGEDDTPPRYDISWLSAATSPRVP